MLRDLWALVRRPSSGLEAISLNRTLPEGLIALGLSVTVPALVAELGAQGPFRPPANLGSLPSLTMQGEDIYARWTYQHRFLLPIYGLLASLILWLIAAALIHMVARALGGRGGFLGYVKLLGFIALVGLLSLPFDMLDALARLQAHARLEQSTSQLVALAGIGIFVWQNVLLVYAARLHYLLSTERAVGAVIGPIGVVAVLLLALGVLAIILLVVSQQGL